MAQLLQDVWKASFTDIQTRLRCRRRRDRASTMCWRSALPTGGQCCRSLRQSTPSSAPRFKNWKQRRRRRRRRTTSRTADIGRPFRVNPTRQVALLTDRSSVKWFVESVSRNTHIRLFPERCNEEQQLGCYTQINTNILIKRFWASEYETCEVLMFLGIVNLTCSRQITKRVQEAPLQKQNFGDLATMTSVEYWLSRGTVQSKSPHRNDAKEG